MGLREARLAPLFIADAIRAAFNFFAIKALLKEALLVMPKNNNLFGEYKEQLHWFIVDVV